jgi:hypothetical protein
MKADIWSTLSLSVCVCVVFSKQSDGILLHKRLWHSHVGDPFLDSTMATVRLLFSSGSAAA